MFLKCFLQFSIFEFHAISHEIRILRPHQQAVTACTKGNNIAAFCRSGYSVFLLFSIIFSHLFHQQIFRIQKAPWISHMLFQYFYANICSYRKFRAVIQEMTLCYPEFTVGYAFYPCCRSVME